MTLWIVWVKPKIAATSWKDLSLKQSTTELIQLSRTQYKCCPLWTIQGKKTMQRKVLADTSLVQLSRTQYECCSLWTIQEKKTMQRKVLVDISLVQRWMIEVLCKRFLENHNTLYFYERFLQNWLLKLSSQKRSKKCYKKNCYQK